MFFSVKSLFVSLLAVPVLIGGTSACSSGTNITGDTDQQRDSSGSQNERADRGTTEETSAYYGQNANQDFRGTVDSNLISAAYLTCGKIDDKASEIGCNAYEPNNDERIPLEGNTSISWRVLVDGRPINGSDINSKGRIITGLHLAMTAGVPRMLGLSDNRTLEVQLCPRNATSTQTPAPGKSDLGTCDGNVLSTFRSTISRLPPAAALGAFGVAQGFITEAFGVGGNSILNAPTFTSFLKSQHFDETFAGSRNFCNPETARPIGNFCMADIFYNIPTNDWTTLKTSWNPGKGRQITTRRDCDMIGRMIWTEICN